LLRKGFELETFVVINFLFQTGEKTMTSAKLPFEK
jgi:hypothetical protein